MVYHSKIKTTSNHYEIQRVMSEVSMKRFLMKLEIVGKPDLKLVNLAELIKTLPVNLDRVAGLS